MSAIKYAKNGRPLEKVGGRWLFISHRRAQQVTWAETGQITTEHVGAATWHRGPDGTRVPASVAALQDERRYIVGRGKRRKEIHVGHADGRARPPAEGIETTSHFNSIPKNVLDFGSQGREQFFIWKGRAYKIKPEHSGEFSDLVRLVQDKYVRLLLPFVPSPQMSMPVTVTERGPVWDADRIETMGKELYEEFTDDDDDEASDIREATSDFLRFAGEMFDQFTVPKKAPTNGKGKKGKKATATRKAGKRAGNAKAPNTGKRKR